MNLKLKTRLNQTIYNLFPVFEIKKSKWKTTWMSVMNLSRKPLMGIKRLMKKLPLSAT